MCKGRYVHHSSNHPAALNFSHRCCIRLCKVQLHHARLHNTACVPKPGFIHRSGLVGHKKLVRYPGVVATSPSPQHPYPKFPREAATNVAGWPLAIIVSQQRARRELFIWPPRAETASSQRGPIPWGGEMSPHASTILTDKPLKLLYFRS